MSPLPFFSDSLFSISLILLFLPRLRCPAVGEPCVHALMFYFKPLGGALEELEFSFPNHPEEKSVVASHGSAGWPLRSKQPLCGRLRWHFNLNGCCGHDGLKDADVYFYYLRIGNAEGNVLIAVYLCACVRVILISQKVLNRIA